MRFKRQLHIHRAYLRWQHSDRDRQLAFGLPPKYASRRGHISIITTNRPTNMTPTRQRIVGRVESYPANITQDSPNPAVRRPRPRTITPIRLLKQRPTHLVTGHVH